MNDAELFNAAISGDIDRFRGEIGAGVLISLDQWTPCRGNTILHAAAKSGTYRIVEIVLNSLSPYSPLYTTNFQGNTALHIAVSLGHYYMSLLLITRATYQGPEVKRLLLRAKNVEQDTALHLAVKHGHYHIVVLLITEDPELTLITNNAGESPLFLAVDRGFFEIALRILDIPECSDEGRNKMNVLHAAVIRVEIKSRFKTIRKDWWCLNIFGSPQLQTYKLDITGADFVRQMLDKFPNAIMKADDFGWTPLHYAAYFGNFEVVRLFLENNNISLAYKRDIQGMSALHISVMKGHCDVMSAIIEKFPYTCELLDNRGRTALHLAAESGRTKAVKILLSSLAFQDLINEQENDEGNTAMHLAAIKKRYKVLKLLAGDTRVEKRATNKEGKTVADILQLDRLWWIKITALWWINFIIRTLVLKPRRSEVLLSLEQEVERQTTEEQIAENEGHEQFKESQRIEPAAKVQGGKGAANNTVDFKEMREYNIVVMTIITTVTFAAAFQVPGGYDGNGKAILVKNKQFRNFLMFDTLSFGSSVASLVIYFAMPVIQKITFNQDLVQPGAMFLGVISLIFMFFAFSAGVAAVLDEKSSLYSLTNTTIVYGLFFPVSLFEIILFIFPIPLIYIRNKLLPFIS